MNGSPAEIQRCDDDEGGRKQTGLLFFAHLSRYAAPKIPLLKWQGKKKNALAPFPFRLIQLSHPTHLCSASRDAIPGPLMNWSGRPGIPGAPPTLIAGLDVTPVTEMLLAAAAAAAAAAAPGSPAAAAAARCAGLSPAAAVCVKKAACAAGWFSAMKGLRGPVGPAETGWGPPTAGPWGPKPLPNGDFSNLGSGMRRKTSPLLRAISYWRKIKAALARTSNLRPSSTDLVMAKRKPDVGFTHPFWPSL